MPNLLNSRNSDPTRKLYDDYKASNPWYTGDYEQFKRDYSQSRGKMFLSYDPNDPYGFLSNNHDPNLSGVRDRTLGGAFGAGVFDPTGNQAIFGALKADAQRQALGRARSANEFARTHGVDPSSAGFAGLQAMLGNQGDLADALLNARTQSGLMNQQWLQNLATNSIGNEQDWMAREQGSILDRAAMRQQDRANSRTNIGQIVGGIAGAAVGAIPGRRARQSAQDGYGAGYDYSFGRN